VSQWIAQYYTVHKHIKPLCNNECEKLISVNSIIEMSGKNKDPFKESLWAAISSIQDIIQVFMKNRMFLTEC